MSRVHPLADAHPFARRERLRPAPPLVMWAGHRAEGGDRVPLRHQQPRASWPGYPSGWCPPDVAKALRELAKGMAARGWDPFACNCIGRDPEQDGEFRGQGGVAAHLPGAYSATSVGWHLSGRAIDVTLPGSCQQPTAERLRMHGDLVELGGLLGWVGIAWVGSYDDWHFERRGPWSELAEKLGTRAGALGALLDVGGWRGSRWEWRAVQAQLWRIGFDAGVLDGYPGGVDSMTRRALMGAGLEPNTVPAVALPLLYGMERPTRGV